MSNSSILGGRNAARNAPGHDTDALGPSDTSDSGSDVQGERPMATGADNADELGAVPVSTGSDSDSFGTGERGSAVGADGPEGADIAPDHIESITGDEDALDIDALEPIDLDTLAIEDDDSDDDDLEALGDGEEDS